MKCIKYDSFAYELCDILSIFMFLLFTLVMCAFTENIVVSAISALIPAIVIKLISVYLKKWKIEYDESRFIKYTLFNEPMEITFDQITDIYTVERKMKMVHKYLIISFKDNQIEIDMSINGAKDFCLFLKERFPHISEE